MGMGIVIVLVLVTDMGRVMGMVGMVMVMIRAGVKVMVRVIRTVRASRHNPSYRSPNYSPGTNTSTNHDYTPRQPQRWVILGSGLG